jgi:hypothetical protein
MHNILHVLQGGIESTRDCNIRNDRELNLLVVSENAAQLVGLLRPTDDETDSVSRVQDVQGDLGADEAGGSGDEDKGHGD